MQNQELRAFVATILKEKNLDDVDQEMIDKMADNLTERLQTQINRALFEALTDEQAQEFSKLVDAEDRAALNTFFTDKGVPVQRIVTETMARFREAYLGS